MSTLIHILKKKKKTLRKVKHEFVAGDSLWGADREVGRGGPTADTEVS